MESKIELMETNRKLQIENDILREENDKTLNERAGFYALSEFLNYAVLETENDRLVEILNMAQSLMTIDDDFYDNIIKQWHEYQADH
jgi:hypothetical protein